MDGIYKVCNSSKTIDDNDTIVINTNVTNDDNDDNQDHDDDDDDDDDDKQQENRSKTNVLEARRKWAMIHFYALRPAFSISLLIYLASLTSGRGALTFHSGVVDPIRNLVSLVQMESNSYLECVQQSAKRTTKRIDELVRISQQSVGELFDSNRETIRRAEETASDCLRDTQKARGSLIQWREDSMDIPWMDIAEGDSNGTTTTTATDGPSSVSSEIKTCTIQKRNQTERLLGQDFRLAEDQVSTALDEYMTDSQNSLENIHHYAKERFEYDWNYFVMERMQPALDYLTENAVSIQAIGINVDYNITEIERLIHVQLQSLQQELEEAKQYIDTLVAKLEDFRDSINEYYMNYSILYDRFVKAANTIYGFLPPGVPLPDVFDISDLNLADFFLPKTGLTWPELELEYADIQKKVQDATEACLATIVEILDNVQIQSVQGLRGAVQQISQALMEILELKNYDPPQFQGSRDGISDITQELDFHSLRGQEAINWTRQALIGLRVPTSTLENVTMNEIETPDISEFDYNFAEDTSTTFEMLSVLLPKLSFLDYVLDKIAFLAKYAFILDILCGFFQWWRLSSIYERGAMPNMPEINYGDGDKDGRERPKRNYKILLLIIKSSINPIFVGFLCLFSFFTFLVIFFWIPHVQHMCVHSTNGTWFANNMIAPAVTNIAMVEGNAQYLLAENACYNSQNQWCVKIGIEIEERSQSDQTALGSFQAQHNRSLEALKLMEECVDTSSMTEMITESCCGLKGYSTVDCVSDSDFICPIDSSTNPPSAYRPFATYLDSSACLEEVHEWTLSDTKYDCTSLKEACYHIPCQGVNDDWIHKYTTQTDCKVEIWLIETCQFWFTVIVHFTALSVICSLIYNGCRDVHWRELSPDSIRLRTHLCENGTLAKGAELEERMEGFSSEIRWFEKKARLQKITGALLLSAYIVTVLVVILRS
ncbi:MAG: hypothetical protein ACI90V_002481 [Bacillariaceae sp.]|jgi:hypothetical protein